MLDLRFLISQTTENPVGDNYFHKERTWAGARAEAFTEAQRPEFYFPVIIDAELEKNKKIVHEPRIFAGCQWNHLPGGVVTEEFGKRLATIQQRVRAQAELKKAQLAGDVH